MPRKELIETLDKGFEAIWEKMHLLHLENRDFIEKVVDEKVSAATTKILACITQQFEALAKDYLRDWESDTQFRASFVERLGLLQDKLHHNLSATYALLSEHDADSELWLEQIHQMLLTLVTYKKEYFVVEKRHDANQKADEFFKSVKEAKEKLISTLQNQRNGNSEQEPENSDEPVPPNQEPKLAPLPLVRQGHGIPVVPETPIETPPPLPVSLLAPECSDSGVKEELPPSP